MSVKFEHIMVYEHKCFCSQVGKGLDPWEACTVTLVETLAESTELLHDCLFVHQLYIVHLLAAAGEELPPREWITADG